MDAEEKIQARKNLNKPFLTAFDWYRKEKKLSQDAMAKAIGSNGSMISLYRNGTKAAGEDIKQRFIAVADIIYRPYLDGKSPYMLRSNVPAEELREGSDWDNPDFEQLQKDKAESLPRVFGNPTHADEIIDLAASLIKEIETLRKQLTEELAEVRTLRTSLTDALSALVTAKAPVTYDMTELKLNQAAEPTEQKR